MHVYITSRNLLSVTTLAQQLHDQKGVTSVTIIDCGSTYQPLLDRYSKLTSQIAIMYTSNRGPRAAWAMYNLQPPYVVTDGDLSIDGWPDDGLVQLREIAEEFPECIKIGAALTITGLPDNAITAQVREHESQFWTRSIERSLYAADIDTTLAVYNTPIWGGYGPSIRHAGLPAKHLPWYIDPANPPDDYRHNFMQQDTQCPTHWTAKLRQVCRQ